ncbi:Cof-type HAD-IIB family hydrolase [Bacillus solitudinis]|uniref:Cof-type HAD-IIB family hydrolase n=1 Tax=Bacillus solitudinis TaxID=2014074 RepID=UPI000C248327|nr:Cof-type HAD-IIB family hydrolase [Bacillus solitudinis]
MTYRLLALNIDGTILRSNSRITRQTKDAIEYVKSKGVYVTLATARPFPSAKKIAKSLKIEGVLVTSDGAFVAETIQDPLLNRQIHEETALQVVEVLEQYDCHIRLLNNKFSIGNKVRQINHLIAKMTINVGEPFFYPITFVDSVYDYLLNEPMSPQKLQVQFLDIKEQQTARSEIEELVNGIRIFESSSGRLEIVSTGVSKVRGLQAVGQHLGISLDEMVAIGSYKNDIEMISQAGLGVAMGNSSAEVKEAADWVTRSNNQHGVSYMVREVFRKQLRVQH